jgi:hypothetical protein
MDYSRFHYVAQPEDKIPAELLIPRVGPYDKFAIKWGYTPVAGAKSPEEEKSALHEIVKVQDSTPWLRFSTARSMGSDPGELTEAVGDEDAIEATTLGTKNIKRVVSSLMEALPEKNAPYDELGAVYSVVIGQWVRELNHVGALVGGFHSQQKHWGQEGVLFTPVPKEKQKAAIALLNRSLFATPSWLVPAEIQRRLEPMGALNRVVNAQRSVLTTLLNPARLARLQEQEALDGDKAYPAAQMLADLREGIFTEVASRAANAPPASGVRIDAFRRNLQRAYIEIINERLNGRPQPVTAVGATSAVVVPLNPHDDARGLLRAELRAISARAGARIAAASDAATRAHLEDLRDRIADVLDPKLPLGGGAGTGGARPSADDIVEDAEECWPNLAILP